VKSSAIPQVLVAEAVAAGILDDAGSRHTAADVQQSFTKLCDLADAGDAKALAIIDKSAVLVARAVSVVTNTLDVERVVFGGPFWSRMAERYLDRIPALVDANSAARLIHAVEVVGTGVGEDVGAIGAACLVLEHTLAPRAQRLLLEA
jgi:predicted NBD/HSP70 family sugar kinase